VPIARRSSRPAAAPAFTPWRSRAKTSRRSWALHRVRSQGIASRPARINGMRALLRKVGVAVPLGLKCFMNDLHQLLAERQDRLPEQVRRTVLSSGMRSETSSRGSPTWRTNSSPSLATNP
jgi:hypothetical protein